MADWVVSLIGAIGTPLILFIWQCFLKRELTEDWGRRIGRVLTIFFRQRLGVTSGNSVAEKFQSTAEDFINGLRQGLKVE